MFCRRHVIAGLVAAILNTPVVAPLDSVIRVQNLWADSSMPSVLSNAENPFNEELAPFTFNPAVLGNPPTMGQAATLTVGTPNDVASVIGLSAKDTITGIDNA